jgi:hypothetical protein
MTAFAAMTGGRMGRGALYEGIPAFAGMTGRGGQDGGTDD